MPETVFKDELLKQWRKQFPDSPLEEMDKSELAEINGWVTTGNYALNWIISKNLFKGLPLGRVILFSGDPSSGKSMISLSMMREPTIDLVVYMDSEGGGVSKEFAEFLGINLNKVLYSQIDTIEELIEKMRFTIDMIEKNKTKKNILMVVDSISMITTAREKDPEGGADMGNKAKATRMFFRQYIRKMQKLNICCVMSGHLTQNIGSYGGGKQVTGGTILGYAPTVEVRFTKVNKESEFEASAKGTSLVKIRAEIEKSRLGTHGKRVKFDLDMQSGLDPYAGIFDILRDYEFVTPALKDVDTQIQEKKIAKNASGSWMFVPWEPISQNIYNKLVEAKEIKNYKFRESKIKVWAAKYDWFLPEVQIMLDSIYTSKDRKIIDEEDPDDEVIVEEKIENEPKKGKKSKIEITEV